MRPAPTASTRTQPTPTSTASPSSRTHGQGPATIAVLEGKAKGRRAGERALEGLPKVTVDGASAERAAHGAGHDPQLRARRRQLPAGRVRLASRRSKRSHGASSVSDAAAPPVRRAGTREALQGGAGGRSHRPQRPQRRRLRLPRPQRRRQDHHAADGARADRAHRGHRRAVRTRPHAPRERGRWRASPGFVEAPRFYPYLGARKNLELLAALDGDGASSRIDEVLETVELTPRAGHKVGGFSHGMRQRLGIAAALLRRPRLLILDEPATGLDPAGMRDMRLLIRRLADDGITVLLSSHQLPEVQELCDRVAIVDRGRVVYEGALADLRRQGGAGYRLRTTDDRRARSTSRAPRRASRHVSVGRARRRLPGGGARRRRAVARARRRRHRHPRAHTRARDARGPVLHASPRATRRNPGGGAERDGRASRSRERARRSRRDALPRARARRPRTLTVYRWELRKLVSQKRTYLGLGARADPAALFFVVVREPAPPARPRRQHLRRADHPVRARHAGADAALPVRLLPAGRRRARRAATSSPTRTATARSRRSSRARSTAARCSRRRRSPP